jgi:hypothetical protein
MRTVNIHDAKTHLSRLVDRAAKGEPFVIAKAGKPLVKDPQRFKGVVPTPPALPTVAWINPPKEGRHAETPTALVH